MRKKAQKVKPIETVYNGYRFRSRLEARWAVFFDSVGFKWEYEPEGYDLGNSKWYLPDFYLGNLGYIEVKGNVPTREEIEKCKLLSSQSEHSVYLLFGNPGFAKVGYEGENPVGLFCSPENVSQGIVPLLFLKDGCMALSFNPVHNGEGSMMDPRLWAWHEGGKENDICLWPAHFDENLSLRRQTCSNAGHILSVYTNISLYQKGVYLGPGRDPKSKKIKNSYAKARQARFEHGEKPNARRWT
jgi:hypothetical protein